MTDYFTSDTHFGHANIIKYCRRPFSDVHEMNRALVRGWNDVVQPEDTVFHIGDFAMGPRADLAGFVRRLHGRKVLVKGNHDRQTNVMLEAGFDHVVAELDYVCGEGTFHLAHRPDFTRAGRVLCGHVHEKWARRGDVINVGVDVRGFRPVTLAELLATPESSTPP